MAYTVSVPEDPVTGVLCIEESCVLDRRIAPGVLGLALAASLLPAAGCKKSPPPEPAVSLTALPEGIDPIDPVPGSVPVPWSELMDRLGLPMSAIPGWAANCDLRVLPERLDRRDMREHALTCGPHAALLVTGPPEGDTPVRSLRVAAANSMANMRATTRASETRPARDGTAVDVEVLRAEERVWAVTTAALQGGRLLGVACSGPEIVDTRGPFCDALIAAFVQPDPTPAPTPGPTPDPDAP